MCDLYLGLGAWLIIVFAVSYQQIMETESLKFRVLIYTFVSVTMIALYFASIPRYTIVGLDFWLYYIANLFVLVGLRYSIPFFKGKSVIWFFLTMFIVWTTFKLYAIYIKGIYFMDEMGVGC